MKYISLILNLPWTFVGLATGIVSIPRRLSHSKEPLALVIRVRSFWWFSWQKGMKRARGMAIGNVVLLGPLEMEKDLEHELIHVRQFERAPLVHPLFYAYQNWKHGYRNNKYEREAYDEAGNDYFGK